MPIRLLNNSDTESWLTLALWTGEVTGGSFWSVTILAIWTISMFSLILAQVSPARSLTGASFFCGVMSIPMAIVGLIPNAPMYLFGVLIGAGLLWMRLENAR